MACAVKHLREHNGSGQMTSYSDQLFYDPALLRLPRLPQASCKKTTRSSWTGSGRQFCRFNQSSFSTLVSDWLSLKAAPAALTETKGNSTTAI